MALLGRLRAVDARQAVGTGQQEPAEANSTSWALVTPLCRPRSGGVNGERWCERRPLAAAVEMALLGRLRAIDARQAVGTGQQEPAEANDTLQALMTPPYRPQKGDVNGER